jgi:CubicO group peptidase (beta-lactamase class C family)
LKKSAFLYQRQALSKRSIAEGKVKMIAKLKRILAMAILVLFGLLSAAFIAISLYDSPEYARRLLMHGQSDMNDYHIFARRPIDNGDKISELERAIDGVPKTIIWYDPVVQKERAEDLDELFELTATNAFVVLRNDEIIYEGYFNGTGPDSIHTSFSSAKSFTSALIMAAVADGLIASVNDPVIQYIPEIAGRGFDELTIRDLLLMSTGIRYIEKSYPSPFGDDALTYYSPDLRRTALRVRASDASVGEAWHYNNYYPLLEGLILERVTGMSVAEYLQERFWKPMGAEYPASWSLDSDASGFEKMESGINGRAVDFARFGLIFLHNGYWNGIQILPEDLVLESTSPDGAWDVSPGPEMSMYYKYHWWGLNNSDGIYDFFAAGRYGQYVYVAPRKNVVIVRLGDTTDYPFSWQLFMQSLVDQME